MALAHPAAAGAVADPDFVSTQHHMDSNLLAPTDVFKHNSLVYATRKLPWYMTNLNTLSST